MWGGRGALRTTKCWFGETKGDLPSRCGGSRRKVGGLKFKEWWTPISQAHEWPIRGENRFAVSSHGPGIRRSRLLGRRLRLTAHHRRGNIPRWAWEPRSRRGRGLGFEEEFAAEVQREDGFCRKKARKYAKRRVERVWGGRGALWTTKCRFGETKADLPQRCRGEMSFAAKRRENTQKEE